ncbi:MAG: glycoside-pentoside-hexuronide (GPH):cation symporter [Ruminococcus sp.]|jgi:GPH family glycoside/pentoside/hexuronide:cation symporter|nr:glycoside-pentoside-hexuronide (GPH):cation symporter [Ruminococcus sp.]
MISKRKWMYGIGNAGAQFIWTFTGSFLTQYYTDSVVVSAAFIGTMMLVMRLADGITDIMQGILIEKTNTRFGKARPWLIISIIPLLVTTVLVFNVPQSLSGTGKAIYICITYFLMATVFYTMFSLGYWAMLPLVAGDSKERAGLSSAANICGFVSGTFISVITVPVLNALGGSTSQFAWRIVAVIFTLFALVLTVACVITTKENKKLKTDKAKPIRIKTSMRELLHTKYFYIAVGFAVCTSMIGAIVLGAPLFFARDVLGNSNYYAYLALVYSLTTVVVIALSPKLYDRFGKRRVMYMGCAIAILGRIAGIFNPYSLALTLVGTFITAVGMSMYTAGAWTLASEIVDFLEPRLGTRIEGLATTATSFGNKVGTGFGAAALGWALAYGGYDASLPSQGIAVQKAEIFLLYFLPMVLCAISFFLIRAWKITTEKRLKPIQAIG